MLSLGAAIGLLILKESLPKTVTPVPEAAESSSV